MPGRGFITVETNKEQFKKTVHDLITKTKYNSIPKVLRLMGNMLVKLLVQWTPPRGSRPASESWAQQKARGMTAASQDINRVFWKLKSWMPVALAGDKHRIKDWTIAVRSGAVIRMTELLKIYNVPSRGVMAGPTTEVHQAAMRQGRVPKNFAPPFHIFDSAALNAYVKSVQKRVGEWKHGWANAVRAMGVRGIPQWIMSQKSDPGICLDRSKDPKEAFIYVENRAGARAPANANALVVPATRIVEKQLVKVLAAQLQKDFDQAK